MAHDQERSSKIDAGAANASRSASAGRFPASARRALWILVFIACGFVLWAAKDFLMPTAAAVVLALILAPIVKLIERFGLPSAAASFIVVIAAGAVLVGGAFVIAPEIGDLIERSPQIAQSIERKTQPIKDWLHSMEAATETLTEATQLTPAATPAPVVAAVEGNGVLDVAPVIIAQTLYVLVLSLFLIATRNTYRNRIILLPKGRENRLRVARILNETLNHVSSYLLVISAINLGVGVITTVLFTLVGVPNAIVWGFIFGLACFVPYLGPTVAILLCLLVQIVTAETLLEAMGPPFILLLINTIESNFVTPWLVSRQLAVSALAIFLTVALFAWLWGPISSIVAVPVLIVVSAVARHVPDLRPWAILLTAENQQIVDAKDSKQRFFAAEGALNGSSSGKWWARKPREDTEPAEPEAAAAD